MQEKEGMQALSSAFKYNLRLNVQRSGLFNAPGPAFGIGNTGFEPAMIVGRLEVLSAYIEPFPLFHIGITVPLNNLWAFI